MRARVHNPLRYTGAGGGIQKIKIVPEETFENIRDYVFFSSKVTYS